MAVRKQHNRYRTEPAGTDFEDVVKKAKAFYKDGTFGIWKYESVWNTFRPSIAFKDPEGTIYFRYVKDHESKRGKWIKETA
ncbi:hypothetical protein [Anaerotignum sp.]